MQDQKKGDCQKPNIQLQKNQHRKDTKTKNLSILFFLQICFPDIDIQGESMRNKRGSSIDSKMIIAIQGGADSATRQK